MLRLSEQVVRVCRGEGISQTELEYMVERAAMTSARGHNRRYFNWLFKVTPFPPDKVKVTSMVTAGALVAHEDVMFEEHEACKGEGCKDCGWLGEIARHVHCN